MKQLTCMLILALAATVSAEDPAERWEKTIQKFEEADRQQAPATGGILFVGSSSIRMWDTDKWFPGDGVLNRGFGGSQISDVNYFADRIVLKYAPKIIAFYAGDNDVAKGKSPEQVFADFKAFLALVEKRLPQTHVLYLPIKPSLARWKMWPTMAQANSLIQRHLETRHNWHYVDTVTPMLGENGKPRPELFLDDGLHMNDQGYKIWSGLVKPLIERALNRSD